MRKLLIATSLLMLALSANAQTAQQGTKQQPVAIIQTSMGDLKCVLFPKAAPIGTANFIGLAKGTKDWKDPKTGQTKHGVPLYDNTTFHRVIPNFMIQGGDPAGTGAGDVGFQFKNETLSEPRIRSAGTSCLRQRRTGYQRLTVFHHRGGVSIPERQLHHLRPVRCRECGAGQENRPPAAQRQR